MCSVEVFYRVTNASGRPTVAGVAGQGQRDNRAESAVTTVDLPAPRPAEPDHESNYKGTGV